MSETRTRSGKVLQVADIEKGSLDKTKKGKNKPVKTSGAESETDDIAEDAETKKLRKLSMNDLLIKLTKCTADTKTIVTEMSQKLDNVIKESEEHVKRITKLEHDFGDLTDRVSKTERENLVLKSENKDLKQRIIQQEAYDRRKNLIFYGVRYLPGEDTFAVVGKFLQSVMKVKDGEKITFDNCYRLKSNQKDKPPPMIVRYVSFRDSDVVWKCGRNLPGTSVSVAENFPRK